MDYDENDFQSQNFQLAGDENKFPASLQPFALPKFDLDEHLQVHLRFDSLVDTGVLLGIQGQDNNWIEDFSSGTSAIEFSSSAADNSISRHNNVWSEATSSESVEMLLRSVGEDEMKDKKVTVMEADAQNVSSGMVDQMDPASRQADDNSMIGDIIQGDPSVLPDKFQRNLLAKDKDGSGVQPQEPQVQGMSQIFSDELSCAELDASSLGDKFNSKREIDAGQCTTGDTVALPSDDTNKKSSVTSECLCNMVPDDEPLKMAFRKSSDAHGWDASEVASGSPDSVTCRSTQEQVMEKHTVINTTEKSNLPSDDVQKERSQTLRHARRNEPFLEGHDVETHLCSRGSSSLLEPHRDSLVLMSEEYNVTGFSDKPDGLLEAITYRVKTLNNDSKVGDMNPLETEKERFIGMDNADVSKENMHSQLTDHNEKGIGNTSQIALEANASIQMESETRNEETKYENGSEINNLSSQSPEPASLEKSIETEVIEEPGSKFFALENVKLGESPFPAIPNNPVVKISSSVSGTLHKAADSPVDKSSTELSAGEVYVEPSTNPHTTNSNNDDHAVIGEAEAATPAGQNSDNVGVSVPIAKKLVHDGSGLPSLVGDGSHEHKDSNSDAPLPGEPVRTSDTVTGGSPLRGMAQDVRGVKASVLDEVFYQSQDAFTADMIPEQKEGTSSSQFSSEFIKSDEKEARVSASSSLTKADGKVNRLLTESDIGENIPFNSTTKPQTALTEQPSSCVESSVASQSKLQSSAGKSVTHEETTTIERSPVNHDSSVNGKDTADVSKASSHEDKETIYGISAELPSHSEGQMLPETTPIVENPSAAPVNFVEHTSTTLSRSNAEAQLAVDTCKPSLPEASCGSPTVISCSGHSQDDPEGGNVEKVEYTVLDTMENTVSEADKNFTFKVGTVELSEKDTGNQWKPFPSAVQSSELPKISKQIQGSCSESEGKHHSKTASGNKTRHASRSSNEKPSTPRGRPAKGTSTPAKGTSTHKKSTDSVGKSCTTSSAPVAIVSSGIQLEEIQPHTYTESNRVKTSGSPIVQSSSMPDLNSSTSATRLFRQPFTDLQQVQLRAQIFVYGSLIQSIPPDEACMQSAFGEADGGRSLWESVWRKSVERYHNQKSPVNSETPLHSHSVVRTPEQATKSSSLQSKAVSASVSRSAAKVIAPAILNSTPPLPSSLWSISTHDGLHSNLPRGAQLDFNQALSPLHSYPSSQTRQFTSNSMQWLPQNPRPGPWAVSAQTPALNAATQYSTVPVVETVQVTPVKDSSMPRVSNTQLATPSSVLPTSSSASVPPASVLHLEIQRKTASPGDNKNASSNQKSRKRKKAAGTEDAAEPIPVSQSSTEPASATTVPKTLPSTPPALPLPTITPSKVASEPIVSAATTHISPTQHQILGSGNTEQRLIFSEETGNKIEQARLQAEDAAAVAASVVSHSHAIWNQLAAQRNSGLVTEVEEKLASAAVAAAAAASVAKASAAATKVASEAALQAKMMADEALDSAKTGSLKQSPEDVCDAGKNLARLTPGSILKGKEKIHGSSSIISAAHEVTKRRLEAASAATKRAENLDAIMKAAELAAEAVFQVGTIIAMGDPLPFKLSDLVEAGPEGSWKAYRLTSEKLNKANHLSAEELKDLDDVGDHHEMMPFNTRDIEKISVRDGIFCDNQTVQSEDNCQGLASGVGNPSTLPNNSRESDHSLSKAEQNVVQKGSVVEVTSDEEGLRGGWFSARVLDVKDNKAHVCFNNLLSDVGSGQLKEWVSLDSESNGAPRIRIAHPTIATKYDGTRKRRREAVSNYVWAVGDRVDARMRDGWWEGIITEKNQLDETKLTVHFPAGGDSSLVRAWDLRPSLVWKDGQWIEWSRARENTLQQYEGDTPQEKRQKLGRLEAKLDTEVDGRGIGKLLKKTPAEDLPQELGPLNLSAKDTIFSVGKNVSEANVTDALKVKQTGLQKEGSRVVFGVPKPGKKRKFMDVSKHYVSDKTDKASQGNDSLKFAKYLMPQVSRPWRNTSKVDSKGKRTGDSKPLAVKSVKSHTTQTRSTTEKVNISLATVSASTGEKHGQRFSANTRAGFGKEENIVEKNSVEVVSFPSSLGSTGSLAAASSLRSLPTLPPLKKSSSTAEADLGLRGKATPVLEKSVRSEKKPSENQGMSIPDAIEPRRSNRRIQPTSRLLEGLQSSLIISKIPTFSHDKGSKALHRSSSSRGHTRG